MCCVAVQRCQLPLLRCLLSANHTNDSNSGAAAGASWLLTGMHTPLVRRLLLCRQRPAEASCVMLKLMLKRHVRALPCRHGHAEWRGLSSPKVLDVVC